MNSVNALPYHSPSRIFSKFPQNSFPVKRRRSRVPHRRSGNKKLFHTPVKPSFDSDSNYTDYSNSQNLKLVLDVDQITSLASSNLHRLASSTQDAFYDLKTLVTIDESNRVVFSCRKSTLQFTGTVLVSGFVLFTAFRFLVKLGLGLSRKLKSSSQNEVVVRRDRSLGGREVVVRVNEAQRGDVKRKGLDKPLSYSGQANGSLGLEFEDWKRYRARSYHKLPNWWPDLAAKEEGRGLVANQEERRREANRLIRGCLSD